MPISGIDTNLINESQEDFKDYIEGLGLGISWAGLGAYRGVQDYNRRYKKDYKYIKINFY
jgi:hypothetical protein